MKIWNTKYCLTAGITEHEVEETTDNLVVPKSTPTPLQSYLHGEGKEWHRSRQSAVKRANVVKDKRLQSLDRSIKKISALEFED